MAFLRLRGCSVGKKVCPHCDTAFEQIHPWHGGGEYSAEELAEWAAPFERVCVTGGEPLDWDLQPLFEALTQRRFGNGGTFVGVHVETSGTRPIPEWLAAQQSAWAPLPRAWICVSPKPGFLESVVQAASEVKAIVPGLGSGEGWPGLKDALRWAETDVPVFIQPRNAKHEIDKENLALCQQLVLEHPQLRLSVQLHKLLRVR